MKRNHNNAFGTSAKLRLPRAVFGAKGQRISVFHAQLRAAKADRARSPLAARMVLTLTTVLAVGLLAGGSFGRASASAGASPIKKPMKTKTEARTAPAQLASENWPQPVPALIGKPDDWINTDGKPLKLKKGVVYLIDFWEYTCVNCQRTLPYLKEWNQRYAKDGLVIVGIHTPEFAFAKDRANVAKAVGQLGITWPVLVDSQYKNWTAFRNSFWPRKYFVNGRGQIVADHAGEGGYAESEARIQALLKANNPALHFPKVMNVVRDTDKPGAVCYPTTAELYAGERGAQSGQHGNITPFAVGNAALFTDLTAHAPHEDGKIYLSGKWRTERESLRYAGGALFDKTGAPYAAIKYHALECNAVIKPEGGKPFRVFVTQDGRPVPVKDRGLDIHADREGGTYIMVDAPRLYRLTKNAKFGTHELRLLPTSPEFGLYSFTFSSCEIR